MSIPTIEWKNNKVKIIDQTALPHKLKFIYCDSAQDVWSVIKTMKIRGAPALGVAAAYGVYLGVRDSKKAFFKDLEKTVKYIATSRPTARNLFWALERMKKKACAHRKEPVERIKRILLKEANEVLREDKDICRKMGKFGSPLIKAGDSILTHCNAGGLATADYGTALGVLFAAKAEGKNIKVYVDETRPVLQGSRLTTWELMREGIDTTLITDNMAASLMAKRKIDKVIVGADRIARNGDTANKIGTYNLAVLSHYHKIPFYVAAPLSTIDTRLKSGKGIPIEQRSPDEVRKIGGSYIAPKKVKVYNPAFDVTPAKFITAIITEKGVLRKPFGRSIRTVKKPTRLPPKAAGCWNLSEERMKELEFIKYLTRKFRAKSPVVRGIGDDCAVLQYTKDKYLLLTCDMIIEGTHFTKKATPYQIGWKAMAVNISDIAAMGGIPKYALVSAGIPRNKGMKFLKEITRGIEAISKKFGVSVIGGDTNTSGKTVLNVTLIGEVEKKCLAIRSGAKPGDLIFVTGALGEGKTKHLTFLPRLKEARILVKNFKISSMIDLSDGLAMDLNRLAKESKIGVRVYKSLIPLSETAIHPGGGKQSTSGVEVVNEAISSGEDFELLFTASIQESKKIIKRMGEKEDLPITLIGEVVDKRLGVKFIEEEGRIRPLRPKGFVHL